MVPEPPRSHPHHRPGAPSAICQSAILPRLRELLSHSATAGAPWGEGTLIYSPTSPQCLRQGPAHSRCSANVAGINLQLRPAFVSAHRGWGFRERQVLSKHLLHSGPQDKNGGCQPSPGFLLPPPWTPNPFPDGRSHRPASCSLGLAPAVFTGLKFLDSKLVHTSGPLHSLSLLLNGLSPGWPCGCQASAPVTSQSSFCPRNPVTPQIASYPASFYCLHTHHSLRFSPSFVENPFIGESGLSGPQAQSTVLFLIASSRRTPPGPAVAGSSGQAGPACSC